MQNDPSSSAPETESEPRWYEDGLSFACTACGRCCKSNGEYSHVYLREEEVGAIADHLGLDPVHFLREHLVVEDGWISLLPDLPSCQFLGNDGKCGIYPVRPVQCRTWPFWDVNLKEATWRGEVQKICPGSRSDDPESRYSADRIDAISGATEDWYEDRLESWPGPPMEP